MRIEFTHTSIFIMDAPSDHKKTKYKQIKRYEQNNHFSISSIIIF